MILVGFLLPTVTNCLPRSFESGEDPEEHLRFLRSSKILDLKLKGHWKLYTTLIEHSVFYQNNHVVTTFTICFWLCQLNSCIDCWQVCILWTFKS